jgi:hypothetical protein
MTTIRTLSKLATVLTGLLLANGCAADADEVSEQTSEVRGPRGPRTPQVEVFASGLTNPRGLTFGPDGSLYVAQTGLGGPLTATDTPDCPAIVNIYSPYHAGYDGSIVRIRPNGTKQVVASGLPSMADSIGSFFGPTDLAFVGNTLYVLIEMGGCSHGLPNDYPAILRVNPNGSTTIVARLGVWHNANPPHYVKDTNPETSDHEPGGVFHSMIADGRYLYVTETNSGYFLRVDTSNGQIKRVYDMSSDNAEHNPIVMTKKGNSFYAGTFGEDDGPSELAVFDKNFNDYTLPFESLNPIVGLAWKGNNLWGVEIFPLDNPWSPDTARLVKFDKHSGARTEVLTDFASFPNSLITGPDGALYTSNWASTWTGDGDGQILRIEVDGCGH